MLIILSAVTQKLALMAKVQDLKHALLVAGKAGHQC